MAASAVKRVDPWLSWKPKGQDHEVSDETLAALEDAAATAEADADAVERRRLTAAARELHARLHGRGAGAPPFDLDSCLEESAFAEAKKAAAKKTATAKSAAKTS